MPVKRRREKARRADLSAAAAIYAERGGIDLQAGVILNEELAQAVGRLPLIAYPDLDELADRLAVYGA